MTRTTMMMGCFLLLVTIGGCTSGDAVIADATPDRDHPEVALGLTSSRQADGDEAVTLDQCPVAVRRTIESRLDGGSLMEIERTTDHGEVLYEVDVRGAAGVVEFDVAADGVFRGYEDDDDGDDGDDDENEEEIPLSEVPDVIREAAINAVDGLVLEEAVRETENGAVVYELEGEAGGQEYEVEVSADGKVLEVELDGEDEDDD